MNHSGKNQKSEEIEMADVEYQRTMKARISRITKYFPHNYCHLTIFLEEFWIQAKSGQTHILVQINQKKKICSENSKL